MTTGSVRHPRAPAGQVGSDDPSGGSRAQGADDSLHDSFGALAPRTTGDLLCEPSGFSTAGLVYRTSRDPLARRSERSYYQLVYSRVPRSLDLLAGARSPLATAPASPRSREARCVPRSRRSAPGNATTRETATVGSTHRERLTGVAPHPERPARATRPKDFGRVPELALATFGYRSLAFVSLKRDGLPDRSEFLGRAYETRRRRGSLKALRAFGEQTPARSLPAAEASPRRSVGTGNPLSSSLATTKSAAKAAAVAGARRSSGFIRCVRLVSPERFFKTPPSCGLLGARFTTARRRSSSALRSLRLGSAQEIRLAQRWARSAHSLPAA